MEKPDANRCWYSEKNIHYKIKRNCIFNDLKKIVAIFLLSLMVFNLAGYRWLFSTIEKKATAKLEQKISSGEYSEEQLVEIRIPLNMPYYSDKEYENVYGETDFNGEHYRFVKRKVSGNTLYLLCLPHTEKTNIARAENEFTQAVNDVPANKQGSQQKNNFIKLLISEFRIHETATTENSFSSLSLQYINRNAAVNDLFFPLTETQPPEA
jgi:hypothetical protein